MLCDTITKLHGGNEIDVVKRVCSRQKLETGFSRVSDVLLF